MGPTYCTAVRCINNHLGYAENRLFCSFMLISLIFHFEVYFFILDKHLLKIKNSILLNFWASLRGTTYFVGISSMYNNTSSLRRLVYDAPETFSANPIFAEVNYEVPVLQLEGSILEYEWAIWNHSQWDISPQHWGGVPYAEVEIDYWPFPLPSQQSIYIRARNTCGWGNWAETIWEVSGGWRYAFSLYPNPVSEELNLSMLDDARIGSLPEGETYSLTIYNDEGSMVYREADVSQTQQTILVRHWKQGTYYLHLLHKEGEMRRRFVVER